MNPDGSFRDAAAAPPAAGTWLDRALARIGGAAVVLTVAAGGFVMVALAILFLGLLLPILIGAGLIAFGSLWWRMRRLRARGGMGPGAGGGSASSGVRFVVIRR
jgi:hypothetical protein